MMVLRPSLLDQRAISMYSSSLYPLQITGASKFSMEARTMRSSAFGAGLEAEVVVFPEFYDVLDHLLALVHFDGIDAEIFAAVVVLHDGLLEGRLDLSSMRFLKDVREPDEERI